MYILYKLRCNVKIFSGISLAGGKGIIRAFPHEFYNAENPFGGTSEQPAPSLPPFLCGLGTRCGQIVGVRNVPDGRFRLEDLDHARHVRHGTGHACAPMRENSASRRGGTVLKFRPLQLGCGNEAFEILEF